LGIPRRHVQEKDVPHPFNPSWCTKCTAWPINKPGLKICKDLR
jgi:hypothetical protein